MAVSLYFGLPGSGKTSILVARAILEAKKIKKGKSIYDSVVSNVRIAFPGVNYCTDFSWLGKYSFCNSLLLIDEASLEFDNRDFKNFSSGLKIFFLEHRHFRCDIELYLQQWDAVDKKIRVITQKVFFVHSGALCKSISYANRIPYGILIPKKGESESEAYGEIVQGYHRGSFLSRLFSWRLWRPSIYKYYDTYSKPDLPDIPLGIIN